MEIALGLAALAFLPLAVSPWEFILLWDDDGNFFKNPMVHNISSQNLWAMATQSYIKVYEPLSFLEKALLIRFAPTDLLPQVYRLCILGCHVVASWQLAGCVFSLLSLLPVSDPPSASVLRRWSSVVALLYCVHPLNMEVIGWPSAGPYAPAALFAFWSIRRYLSSYSGLGKGWADAPPAVWPLSPTFLLLALSLLHKSVCILLPIALVGLDAALRAPCASVSTREVLAFLGTSLARKLSLIALAASFLPPMLLSNAHDSGFGVDSDVERVNFSQRIVLSCYRFWATFVSAVAPFNLRSHYRIPSGLLDLPFQRPVEDIPSLFPEGISTSLAMSLGLTVTSKWSPRAEPLVVCVATAMFAVWILKHVHDRPYIAGAAWFYAVVMAPVLGIIPHGMISLLADRYCYVPVSVCAPFFAFCLARSEGKRRWWPWLLSIALISIAVVLSHAQLETWRTPDTFLAHGLSVDPLDWRMHSISSERAHVQGRLSTMRYHILLELEYLPPATRNPKAALSRGRSLYLLGEHDAACELFKWAEHAWDAPGEVLNNLGLCSVRENNVTAVKMYFERAVAKLPTREEVAQNYRTSLSYTSGPFPGLFVY